MDPDPSREQTTPSQPRAALWDLDGTLLDSEEYHWLAWRDTLAVEGRELTVQQFAASFGQRNDTILRDFAPELPESEMNRIAQDKEKRFRGLVRRRGVELLPGVREWLTRLRAAGWCQAIASSAPLLNIQTLLAACDLVGDFEVVVSAEDVQRGKPDPEVYMMAAARLDVSPGRCIVIEDAAAGVEGARRAGMQVIGVRTSQAIARANRGVTTLDQLPDDAFERLLAGLSR